MNKKLALLATPIVMLSASTAIAGDTLWDTSKLAPYVGLDAQWRHMNFEDASGGNLLKHDSPQGNIYLGIKLTDYFGLEAGYEATSRKTRSSSVGPGEVVAGGNPLPAGIFANFDTTMSVHGPHINLTGTYPICDQYKLDFIGFVGMARLQAKFTRKQTGNQAGPLVPPTTTIFKKKKSVLRLGAGVQHMLNETWGVRATVTYENTSRLKALAISNSAGLATTGLAIRPENSLTYGFGTFVKF